MLASNVFFFPLEVDLYVVQYPFLVPLESVARYISAQTSVNVNARLPRLRKASFDRPRCLLRLLNPA